MEFVCSSRRGLTRPELAQRRGLADGGAAAADLWRCDWRGRWFHVRANATLCHCRESNVEGPVVCGILWRSSSLAHKSLFRWQRSPRCEEIPYIIPFYALRLQHFTHQKKLTRRR